MYSFLVTVFVFFFKKKNQEIFLTFHYFKTLLSSGFVDCQALYGEIKCPLRLSHQETDICSIQTEEEADPGGVSAVNLSNPACTAGREIFLLE